MKGGNFQFLPLNLQILSIFLQKMLILKTLFQKCNFGQFSTSESKVYGEIFSPTREKINFLAEYSPMVKSVQFREKPYCTQFGQK